MRFPGNGKKDPIFGLSESWLHNAVRRGWIQKKTAIAPGCRKGVSMLDVASIENFFASCGDAPAGNNSAAIAANKKKRASK